ncbi:MAG: hypothetical protein MJE68_17855 [Proteobacteria bacterium]|nr:hypothetical protein [Pseudomonadota bacterium]
MNLDWIRQEATEEDHKTPQKYSRILAKACVQVLQLMIIDFDELGLIAECHIQVTASSPMQGCSIREV